MKDPVIKLAEQILIAIASKDGSTMHPATAATRAWNAANELTALTGKGKYVTEEQFKELNKHLDRIESGIKSKL